MGFSGGWDHKESSCDVGDPSFHAQVGKIPWRREWQPTPVSLPGEFHGQRSLFMFWPHLPACGILVPRPGIGPRALHWKHRALTTGPPGESPGYLVLTMDTMYGVSLYGKFRSAVIMYFMPTDIFSYTCEHTAQTGGEQTPSHCVLGGTHEAEASQLMVSGTQGLHGGITGPRIQRPARGPAASRGGSRDPGESPALMWYRLPCVPARTPERSGTWALHVASHTSAHLILPWEVDTVVILQMIPWRMKGRMASLCQQR